jgi:precorrin-6Y C5,15-methyltransferase (decarboxylating)
MDAEDHQLIVSNAERFGLKNIVAVLGRAPDAWTELPDPEAIFVGGSGR